MQIGTIAEADWCRQWCITDRNGAKDKFKGDRIGVTTFSGAQSGSMQAHGEPPSIPEAAELALANMCGQAKIEPKSFRNPLCAKGGLWRVQGQFLPQPPHWSHIGLSDVVQYCSRRDGFLAPVKFSLE